ncbi:hypothetical protein ABC435_04710, partial [Brucella melitensis]
SCFAIKYACFQLNFHIYFKCLTFFFWGQMRKFVKRTAICGSLLLIAIFMMNSWSGIQSGHNAFRPVSKSKPASSETCKEYNEKGFIGKLFDFSARGWCD